MAPNDSMRDHSEKYYTAGNEHTVARLPSRIGGALATKFGKNTQGCENMRDDTHAEGDTSLKHTQAQSHTQTNTLSFFF